MSPLVALQEKKLVMNPEITMRFQNCVSTLGEEKTLHIFTEGVLDLLEDMEDTAIIFQRKSESQSGISLSSMKKKYAHV